MLALTSREENKASRGRQAVPYIQMKRLIVALSTPSATANLCCLLLIQGGSMVMPRRVRRGLGATACCMWSDSNRSRLGAASIAPFDDRANGLRP